MRDLFEAYEDGHAAVLLEERSLYDLTCDEAGRLVPAIEVLRSRARLTCGMHVITYSMAQGLDWDATRLVDHAERTRVEETLRLNGLLDVPQDQNEIVRVLRGVASMARARRDDLRWSDGRPLRFAFVLEFAEHLAPGTLTNGTQSDVQLVAIELAHIVGQSLALRGSGNLVVFHGRHSLVDPLVTRALRRVRFQHPDEAEKHAFTTSALAVYSDARLAEGLTPADVARLTTNTPNRGLEQLLRAAHRRKRGVTAGELTEQKRQDVVSLSEQSLSVLDARRVADVQLVGRNIARPLAILRQLAARLRAGDRRMHANVVLAGAPGTGKTDLAVMTANAAGVTAYQMHSPKRGIVGETERLSELQQSLLSHWTPNVSFIDEISEALPMERSDFNGDSGASAAVMAALLTALSDESRRGRSLLIGTTNCLWRIGHAMRSRLTVIPVLQPLADDMPSIIVATAARVQPGLQLDTKDPALIDAASVFSAKGASPRHVRGALTNAVLFVDSLTPQVVLQAAQNMTVAADATSSVFADLWAIRCCASNEFLPWYGDPSYPFPPHLREVVDSATGEVRADELRRQLDELAPHANV